jgi:hypothetical protein
MPILTREESRLLHDSFCGSCTAKKSMPIVASNGHITGWLDRCPAGFQVGDTLCVKSVWWNRITETMKEAKEYIYRES